ncbi:CbtB-domain containing protein [Aurantimonas sp. Leaf443]|uniref:CbtB domain-containing protein n=1 Tax=Aurantimonas sp. Leaf443 TaxID=1736378 RepID=UPI0006F213F0|nr:CbtB-domain containing protein [Aurantimonas sp. Leaf443]KQT88202.1 cobalt transporter [Aurantimonas sp. Leaf443]
MIQSSRALPQRAAQADLSTRIATGLLALACGAFLVWGAGFAKADALHDAAHDLRHSYGFPCH